MWKTTKFNIVGGWISINNNNKKNPDSRSLHLQKKLQIFKLALEHTAVASNERRPDCTEKVSPACALQK